LWGEPGWGESNRQQPKSAQSGTATYKRNNVSRYNPNDLSGRRISGENDGPVGASCCDRKAVSDLGRLPPKSRKQRLRVRYIADCAGNLHKLPDDCAFASWTAGGIALQASRCACQADFSGPDETFPIKKLVKEAAHDCKFAILAGFFIEA
jgi:hypothetical protein